MQIETKEQFDSFLNGCRLSIAEHGYVITDGGWGKQMLQDPFSRLYYVISGSAYFTTPQGKVKIEPGYVYFAPYDMKYGFYGDPAVEKFFFHINLLTPDGYDLFSNTHRILRFPRSPKELQALLCAYRSDRASDSIALKAELWRTVAEAAQALVRSPWQPSHSKTVSDAIDYIRTHLSSSLTRKELADALFCSVSTLSWHFKEEMNISIADYIDDLVMIRARELLIASPQKSIGDISTELGFCDQFYFSRRFRARFAITPKDYRKFRLQPELSVNLPIPVSKEEPL